MYLALAPVVALVALGIHAALLRLQAARALRWAGCVLAPAAVVALLLATVARNRDYQDPIRMGSGVVSMRPWNFRVHNNLGLGLRGAGFHEQAENHFREAVRLSPNCWYALYNLGVSLDWRGDYAGAAAYYERRLRSHAYQPAHGKAANALNNLGLELRRKHRLDDAAALFRRAMAYDARFWRAHYNLGLVLSAQGHYKPTSAEFDQPLRLHPGYTDAVDQAIWAANHDLPQRLSRTTPRVPVSLGRSPQYQVGSAF